MTSVAEYQVQCLFNGLDGSKTSISVPNTLIRMASSILSRLFLLRYTTDLLIRELFPKILKISRITPIYKSGNSADPNNYRPISTLSPFAKVLERLVYDQLELFLTKKKLIYDYQFGFRKGYSTEQAILEITDNIKTSIDNKEITRGTQLAWFSDYLVNRYQYVKIGNVESDLLRITCGIPQGSTLGPLLFTLYINDMPNCSNKLSFRIFADDTNVFYSNSSIDEIGRVMNEELNHIFQYCMINKLSINYNKTNYMLLKPSNKKTRHIIINNIEEKAYIKYLAIYIDNNFKWTQQIKHVASKIAKNILEFSINLDTI